MNNLTGVCSLCGKEVAFEELSMLSVVDKQFRKFALACLHGTEKKIPDELECCVRRGLSSSATFCPECKDILEKECEE